MNISVICSKYARCWPAVFLLATCLASSSFAGEAAGEFDSAAWDVSRAKVLDFLGRRALTGTALLKDVSFRNGIIEVDIATTEKSRSYPGVLFRATDASNCERVYIRPHRSPFYDDALQYAPLFNGVDSWQLYNGPGRTAALDIPSDRWNHMKIVVSGSQARVFWNEGKEPAMIIDHLAHDEAKGTIGLSGPMDGTAYFSNFSYKASDALDLPAVAPREPVCGILHQWELSDPYPLMEADFTEYPDGQLMSKLQWQTVQADDQGLVDVSRYFARKNRGGDCILAKTTLTVDADTLLRLGFGYSDFVTVFLNQRPVYFGNSAYRSRDKSFLGIVGYFDNLFLPLKKGPNELMVQVGESMGGWAFSFRKEDEVCHAEDMEKRWTVKGPFSIPESIVCDPSGSVCYVSSYFNEGKEFISKISPTGEVVAREWVTGLRMPTGMCLHGNTLYVVDRGGLQSIDTVKGAITSTIPLEGVLMPNDVAMDRDGNLYVSDTTGNAVYTYSGGKLEKWIDNLDGPNALFCENSRLLIGQNAGMLAADLRSGTVSTIADFEIDSNIDGIQPDGRGNYLVSDYHGKLYHVTAKGSKTMLLNSATPGQEIADFAYLPDRQLIIIPALSDNSVVAYSFRPDAASSSAVQTPPGVTQADEMYRLGKFDEAAQLYAALAKNDPAPFGAVLGLARISLLRNDLNQAEARLKEAMLLEPKEKEPQELMGEVLYRKNRYAQAAPYFESVGRRARAEELKQFEGKTPFEIESGPDVSSLQFLQTDPLPVINVTVNGVEGNFLIDTGGWELHVMPAFAEKCGLKPIAEKDVGTYAGGRQAAVSRAVADRVQLGDFSLRNVPIVIPERSGGPLKVDGVVGTVVLYHFIFTLDYPGNRLILRRNTPDMSAKVRAESEKAGSVLVPFWLAGDHFIYAAGTANNAGPYLFLVDTGMAGGGFSCPEYVIKEAKIELPKDGFQGMGGGGPVTVYPFKVNLSLGEARQDGVQGLYGAMPPGFEERLGFRTGGIISHAFFRPYAVTFDFRAMSLYLRKG